jgi:hypothetical protein
MNTKLLMTVSAFTLGVAGLLLSFLPKELSNYLGLPEINAILLQILGSLYFAFAILNWTAKANLIGGIYGRPVAIGNLAHFLIGGLALARFAAKNSSLPYTWIAAIAYLLFALFFGYVFFNNPVLKKNAA